MTNDAALVAELRREMADERGALAFKTNLLWINRARLLDLADECLRLRGGGIVRELEIVRLRAEVAKLRKVRERREAVKDDRRPRRREGEGVKISRKREQAIYDAVYQRLMRLRIDLARDSALGSSKIGEKVDLLVAQAMDDAASAAVGAAKEG